MKIAASETVRTIWPSLAPLPSGSTPVDVSIILSTDWHPSYSERRRTLRYVIVSTLEEVEVLLKELGHA